MKTKEEIIQIIQQQGLIPLYYESDKEVAASVMRALYHGGVRVIEWTDRGPEALRNFAMLRQLANEEMPDLVLGAGTIKTRSQAENFIKEGAAFIVSPACIKEVADTANEENLLWIPGCMTPTEIAAAEVNGAIIIKVFPATAVGPSFISAVKEVFPGLHFMPTGGITPQRDILEPWFRAGVTAVGIGGSLISKVIIQNAQYTNLSAATQKLLEDIQEIRKR